MSKEDLWKTYTERNPSFDGDGMVTLSARGLRKLFEQTWEHAQDHGFENGKAWQKDRTERFARAERNGYQSKAFADMMKKTIF